MVSFTKDRRRSRFGFRHTISVSPRGTEKIGLSPRTIFVILNLQKVMTKATRFSVFVLSLRSRSKVPMPCLLGEFGLLSLKIASKNTSKPLVRIRRRSGALGGCPSTFRFTIYLMLALLLSTLNVIFNGVRRGKDQRPIFGRVPIRFPLINAKGLAGERQ